MGHTPIWSGLIFEGRFQFNTQAMAFITKIGFMAHGTNALALLGDTSMVVRKIGRMDIPPIGKRLLLGIMTVQAILHSDAFFLFMHQRRCPAFACAGAGQNDTDEDHN